MSCRTVRYTCLAWGVPLLHMLSGTDATQRTQTSASSHLRYRCSIADITVLMQLQAVWNNGQQLRACLRG